jgi:two-component system NarL family sensor kinase
MTLETALLSDQIALYIRLIWLLSIIIAVLMLCICFLYLSMRRAEERESESFAFSHLVIEGLETERRRISRDLHDTVLPFVRNQPVSDVIRSICMELMPPDFARLSLKDLLTELCVQFSARTKIECGCSIEAEIDFQGIGAEHQLHLYRMVQESFNNIERHSGAKKAALVVRRCGRDEADILLCVSDDGVGLGNAGTAGLGMKSIRQRAAILGAKLDFISESGNGLMVRIELPAVSSSQAGGETQVG